jgi:hypothetical protein
MKTLMLLSIVVMLPACIYGPERRGYYGGWVSHPAQPNYWCPPRYPNGNCPDHYYPGYPSARRYPVWGGVDRWHESYRGRP